MFETRRIFMTAHELGKRLLELDPDNKLSVVVDELAVHYAEQTIAQHLGDQYFSELIQDHSRSPYFDIVSIMIRGGKTPVINLHLFGVSHAIAHDTKFKIDIDKSVHSDLKQALSWKMDSKRKEILKFKETL
jgi:hypothetical protein